MGEENRAFKGVWICAAIFLDENLTPAEKMLLAEIDSLTTDDHGCYASNAHFVKRLGVTGSRLNHVVARLTREGYIIRVCYDGRISQSCRTGVQLQSGYFTPFDRTASQICQK